MKTKTYSPPYPQKFSSGDIAIAKEDVNFSDGTNHKKGQKITVTEKTVSYYNVCHNDYDKFEFEGLSEKLKSSAKESLYFEKIKDITMDDV